MIVTELWAEFAEYGVKFRPSWRSTQATHWPHLEPFFGATEVMKLDHTQVDDYRAYRRTCLTRLGDFVSASTRNREVHSLTAMCKWGVKRKKIPAHPLLYIDNEPEEPKQRGYLSEQGLTLILNNLAQYGTRLDVNIVQTLYDAGLRLGELLALEPRHVQVVGGVPVALSLDKGATKNGEPRTVPLIGRASDAVATEMRRGQRYVFGHEGWKYHDDTLRRHFTAAREAAGLPDNILLHSCRHSCATNLRRRGVDWHLVKAIMGHLTEAAARIYQHVDSAEYRKVVQVMEEGISRENAPAVVVHGPQTDRVINT